MEQGQENKRSLKNVKQHMGIDEGVFVQSMFILFYLLERTSLFSIVRKVVSWLYKIVFKSDKKPITNTYLFSEIWTIACVLYAIIAKYIVTTQAIGRAMVVFLGILSFWRVFGSFVYQLNVVFFHRLNEIYLLPKDSERQVAAEKSEAYYIKSVTRTILLLLVNMIDYILQFSVMYACLCALGITTAQGDSFGIFISPGAISGTKDKWYLAVAYYETIVGVFMNLICIGRFIGMLPAVNTKDKV